MGLSGIKKPISEFEIISVQKIAKSKSECSRLLGVSICTYIKYARLYGLDIKFTKPDGTRKYTIKKGPRNPFKTRQPIDAILQNKYKGLNKNTVKNRLFSAGLKKEECELCKYSDKREIDGKSPLMLRQKDQNPDNYSFDNLEILCFNCFFTYYDGWYISGEKSLRKCKKVNG
jgi:hypothetical protein